MVWRTLVTPAPGLLRYLLKLMSWQQFRMELDGGEVRAADVGSRAGTRAGRRFLVSSLPDDDRFKPLAAKALADGRLARSIDGLSDDELVALCDYRAASRRARRRGEPFLLQFSPRGPVVTECPRTPDSRGALFDYFWRSRDQLFRRHLETVARRLPAARQPAVFVHGHTHLPDRGAGGRHHARRRSPDDSPAGLLARSRRGHAGRDQRRRVAAHHHTGPV